MNQSKNATPKPVVDPAKKAEALERWKQRSRLKEAVSRITGDPELQKALKGKGFFTLCTAGVPGQGRLEFGVSVAEHGTGVEPAGRGRYLFASGSCGGLALSVRKGRAGCLIYLDEERRGMPRKGEKAYVFRSFYEPSVTASGYPHLIYLDTAVGADALLKGYQELKARLAKNAAVPVQA